jgi:MFS family permease
LFPTVALWVFFLATSLAFSLRDFAGSAMGTASSLFLQKARSFDSGSTGLVLSGIFAASAISNPLFGHLSDRSRIRWLTVLLLASAALIALFPHVSVSWMIPVLLAYGFFFMASYPINEAALMEAVHESVRGRVFGLFLTICGLLANLSHWLVGDWVHKLGSRASVPGSYFPLYTILALMVVASLSALPFLHALRKREEEIAPNVASAEETIQPARGR